MKTLNAKPSVCNETKLLEYYALFIPGVSESWGTRASGSESDFLTKRRFFLEVLEGVSSSRTIFRTSCCLYFPDCSLRMKPENGEREN